MRERERHVLTRLGSLWWYGVAAVLQSVSIADAVYLSNLAMAKVSVRLSVSVLCQNDAIASWNLHCQSAADLGFYKGGCPIHLKRTLEVERRRRRKGWGLWRGLGPLARKLLYFLYQNREFLCIPGDIYWHCSFQKGHPNQKCGRRVSGHSGHPLDPPLSTPWKTLVSEFLRVSRNSKGCLD